MVRKGKREGDSQESHCLEIEEFLKYHPKEYVLVCQVGKKGGKQSPSPKAIIDIEKEIGELFLPDLRGWSTSNKKKERKKLELEAISLLAAHRRFFTSPKQNQMPKTAVKGAVIDEYWELKSR